MTSTRVLFISGSIGLGHARRDLAIARQLRRLNPGVEIAWLAGEPARQVIAEAGETLLPEAAAYGEETSSAEDVSEEFSLNLMSMGLRAQGAFKRTVAMFEEVSAKYPYDLLIGDETYEIAWTLSKRPELKKAPFVMIYDFVGMDAMSRNPLEQLMAYQVNWAWSGGPRGQPPSADLVLFIGEPEDVADRPFGFLLPNRREYARRHYHFVGYTFPFDAADYTDRAKVRAGLGYDDRPLIVCSVGGTAVGADLLRLCAAAYPHIEKRVEGVRMVLVCGPRIDPATVQAPSGVEVRRYVPRLYEQFAASDVAIVQGGGTTTLELTALRRPFIYFPLEGHFEQNLVVAQRLARHRAGQRLLYSETTPETLAEAVLGQLGREVTWPAIPTDGARRAAELINELGTGAPGEGGCLKSEGSAGEKEQWRHEMSTEPREVQGRDDQPRAPGDKPSFAEIVRAFGVTIGPSLLLDLFVAASTLFIVTGQIMRLKKRTARLLRPLAILGAVLPWAYALVVRPWHLRWGATDEEVGKPLPGDELVPNPAIESTRAITVNAPVEEVWPWLAQIGQDRGGFYSYEWLENLAGCRMRNADRIHPEWQHREVGERVFLHPAIGLEVKKFEPGRAIVLEGWGSFVVEPIDEKSTRVIIRSRVPRRLSVLLYYLLTIEIPHFIMERRMLKDIKERAERAEDTQMAAARRNVLGN